MQEMEDCEAVFIDCLKDGVEVLVEPQCHATGAVPSNKDVDWTALETDLKSFGGDYQVDFKALRVAFRCVFMRSRRSFGPVLKVARGLGAGL